MRYLTLLLLLPFSAMADIPGLQVNGNTISWTANSGWMQVQSTTTYESVCEGLIDSCEVTPGSYNVINHSASERSNNVAISATQAAPAALDILRPYVHCFDDIACAVACPAGYVAIGGSCSASTGDIPLGLMGSLTLEDAHHCSMGQQVQADVITAQTICISQ